MRLLKLKSSDDTDVLIVAENVASVRQAKDGGCVIFFVGGGHMTTTASYAEVFDAMERLAGGTVS